MGRVHARNLARNIPSCELKIICDISSTRAKSASRELQTEYCTHHRDIARRDDVDAVVIATPSESHSALIRSFTKAGKHVFCEKPMCLTMEEAKICVKAETRSEVKVQIGFMRRFDNSYVAMKRAITSKEV